MFTLILHTGKDCNLFCCTVGISDVYVVYFLVQLNIDQWFVEITVTVPETGAERRDKRRCTRTPVPIHAVPKE